MIKNKFSHVIQLVKHVRITHNNIVPHVIQNCLEKLMIIKSVNVWINFTKLLMFAKV